MPPQEAIAGLDDALVEAGEDIVLTRPNVTPAVAPVTVRGRAVGYTPVELIPGSGIMQGDIKVIMSTSQIDAAGWPGTTQLVGQPDQRIPNKGDRMMIGGRPVAVIALAAVYRMDNVIVRMEVQTRGS